MQEILNQAYNRRSFIEKVLIPTVQGRVDDLKIYDSSGEEHFELTDSEQQYAKSAIKYGEFTTRDETGRKVSLYEEILKDTQLVERSRVGIAALVKKHMTGNEAVLVNFAYENPENRPWRFLFIAHDAVFAAGEMKQTATNPKRYTYVFGEPEETYRTALERFDALGREKDITVASLKNAFSVEALNEAFYKIIAEQFYQLAGGTTGTGTTGSKKAKTYEGVLKLPSVAKENRRVYQEFAVRLIGRTVFCWFLKVKKSKDGKPLVPESLLSSEALKTNTNYYHRILEPLFFQTLNTHKEKRISHLPEGCENVPFLNGGLFEYGPDDFYKFNKTTHAKDVTGGLSDHLNTLVIPGMV